MSFDILGVEIDIASFFESYPWVLILIPILLGVGVSFGWKKLVGLYQMQGKPLRPLGTILKEVTSLMFKEDIYCVITKKGENVESLLWFTWIFFWSWLASLTGVLAIISLMNSFSLLPIQLAPAILGWAWLIVILLWFYGIGHLRKVFAHRFGILEKMFNVAASEMKYEGGANAKIYIYQYVIISGWKQVYYPEDTQIMYSVNRFKATEQGRQAAFQAAFDSSVTDKNSWSYEWDTANNRVICSPIPFLHSNVAYPFPDRHPWNEFPLGSTFGDEEVVWDVATFPHMLVAGTTGSGKSVTQRTILLHALQSPDWRVLLIDPKKVELSQYPGHPNVLKLATENDEAHALIQQLEQEMMNRYARMKEAGVNHFKSLPTVPPAILLMVDEVFALLELTAGASRTDPVIKEQNEMKASMTLLVGKIARLGRAAGIHMVLATQRPDAKVLPGEVKANLDARIAQGRMDKTPSDMTLNSQAATKLPPIKGRAIYRAGNDLIEFQAYFLAPENLPEFLELSAMIVRGEGDFLFEEEEDPNEVAASSNKKEFTMPKINLNFGSKFNSWLQKKQAAMEENEAKAGRSVIANKQPTLSEKEMYKDDPSSSNKSYISPEERAKIEREALMEMGLDDSNDFVDETFTNIKPASEIKNAETLFPAPSPVTEKFDFEYGEDEYADDYDEDYGDLLSDDPLQGTAGQDLQAIDSVYEEYEDDLEFDDEEEDIVSFEAEERAEKATRLEKEEASDYSTIDDFEDDVVERNQEESFSESDILTVADVLRIASERGVPIPASELLAALKAEAAAHTNARKPSPQQSKPAAVQTKIENAEAAPQQRKQQFEEVKTRNRPIMPALKPPTNKIPSPPKLTKESQEILEAADFGEHLLDPEDVSGENLPPWMIGSDLDEVEPAAFNPNAGVSIPGIERKPEEFLRPAKDEEEPKIPKRPKLF
jgi:hypothetical protein